MAPVTNLLKELNMITLSNLFLLSILLLTIFILFSIFRLGEKLKSPPSPTRLPIIGNLHQLSTLAHRSLHTLSKKYGPLMLLHLGQFPTLVVSSADMAREIKKTHDSVLCGRPQSTASNILFYGCKSLAFSPYGEYWRQVRKLCVVELLSLKRVQQFQYAREEEVAELVMRIRKKCLSESPIDLSDMLIKTANNILSRCVIGKRFGGEENDDWFGEASRRLLVQLMSFSIGDFFPSLRWIDNLRGFIARLKATSAEFDGFFDQLIEQHKATKGECKLETRDFVDILLKYGKDYALDLDLTQDNLKAILQDMFVAGGDTTATTMEWLMAELVRNPNVMEKVQQEVRRVVGQKAKVDVDDINQMDYLKCVIKETLRLHPPIPLIPQETIRGVTLGGYYIPAKTRVFVNVFAIQRDPKFWDKPEEFLPDRFEDNSIDFNGQDFQYMPFGGGRRGCPGQAFAMAEIGYLVANLLYWFDWKLPGGTVSPETVDMSELYGAVVYKKSHIRLVPVPFSP